MKVYSEALIGASAAALSQVLTELATVRGVSSQVAASRKDCNPYAIHAD